MAVQVAYSEQAAALRCARALVRDDLTWREAETLRLLDDRYQKSVAFSASTLLTGSPPGSYFVIELSVRSVETTGVQQFDMSLAAVGYPSRTVALGSCKGNTVTVACPSSSAQRDANAAMDLPM